MTLRVRVVLHGDKRLVARRCEFFRRQREDERVRIAVLELAYRVHLRTDLEHGRRTGSRERARAVHFDLDAGLAAQRLGRIDIVNAQRVTLRRVQIEFCRDHCDNSGKTNQKDNQCSFQVPIHLCVIARSPERAERVEGRC